MPRCTSCILVIDDSSGQSTMNVDDSSGQSTMNVNWNVGGEIQPYANAIIRGNGSAGFWYFPTCIQLTQQYVPGTYNVTVALKGDSTANFLRESYLVLTAHYD